MKSYRKALCLCVLVMALASPAFAGDIQHPVVPSPPPTVNGEVEPRVADDVTQTGEAETTPEAETLTETALNLLQSVLSLF